MKIRYGFVSNSSSSSFIIELQHLNADQIQNVFDHPESDQFKEFCLGMREYNTWKIEKTDTHLKGSVSMDNFDMHHFLISVLGVDEDVIKWKDNY